MLPLPPRLRLRNYRAELHPLIKQLCDPRQFVSDTASLERTTTTTNSFLGVGWYEWYEGTLLVLRSFLTSSEKSTRNARLGGKN